MREVEIEADGGSRGNPGVAGYGALVRDVATGNIVRELASPIGQASNNVAEYRGLIAGLAAVSELPGPVRVTALMDSKLVVEQMSGRWKIKHADMRELAAEAQEIARSIVAGGGQVQYRWVPREQNSRADALSNEGMDGKTIDRGDGADDEPVPAPRVSQKYAQQVWRLPQHVPVRSAAEAAPLRVILVRHGESAANAAHTIVGRHGEDVPLTERGEHQAHAAGWWIEQFWPTEQPPNIMVSPLTRAHRTGNIIAERWQAATTSSELWEEQSMGEWDGLTLEDIETQWPGHLAHVRTDPAQCPPGGESFAEVRARVAQAWAEVIEHSDPHRNLVVVTHRTPIDAVVGGALGVSRRDLWNYALPPGSMVAVRVWPDGGLVIEGVYSGQMVTSAYEAANTR